MKRIKVGIIGHFGGNETILDGQTIKTKILFDELRKKTDWDLVTVDTYYKKRPFKLLIETMKCLLSVQDIIILLSKNGMKIYFPLLSFFSKVFNKRIYHDVIGGNLDSYVKQYPAFRRYLNSFRVNWVETNSLKTKLEACGVNNCEVMPNFKRLSIADLQKAQESEPFRFCIFSRVMKEKGIETAIDAILHINAEYNRNICELDIYGKIDERYEADFEVVMQNATAAVRYKGIVPYDQSVETIKEYYALLFPTYWNGEGFPGTIIDAFSAGLPVIATDWNCNGEIIVNKENGILYPNEEIPDLEEAIQWIIDNRACMDCMKLNCIESAKKYQPDLYVKRIVEFIETA